MKTQKDELEEALFQALAASERREILRVAARDQGATYTQILGELNMTTGNLNYHLKQLEGLLEKDQERRYRPTPLGAAAVNVLASASEAPPSAEGYVEAARDSQTGSVHPTVTRILLLAAAFNALFLAIWGYIAYIAVTEGGPTFVLGVLGFLLAAGALTLTWLLRSLRTAPAYVRRLERKLGLTG
ncbi:MAG: winged helix-turn-helix domain-containing protein [Candidatus Bathyarchaeota archaeon]